MSLLRKSKRRPAPLTDADYDHEIRLEDHTKTQSPQGHSRSHSDGLQPSSTHVSDSSSRRHSDVPLYKHTTPLHIREELLRRKFSKYQDRHEGSYDGPQGAAGSEDGDEAQNDEAQAGETEEGRPRTSQSIRKPKPSDADSAIDILFENQRGGFICGIPLFSSKALGGLDHAPWTNSVHKPSATDITNAQVPDPSWEWAWKDWHINKEDGSHVDEDGWEYSFAFGKKISWHGPQWWNSYVRRRAWTRKRVKKHSGYQSNQPHMLAPEYFTIHAVEERVPSRATSMEASTMNRPSFGSLARRDIDEDIVIEDIKDIASLMRILRVARIDREKTEAVEHFTEHGGDDLYYLQEYMHEIMRMFIFQASRRLLLTHLLKIFNEASEQQKKSSEEEVDPAKKRRLEYLEAAVKHADEEVKKLEFWSDVKNMAQKGQTLGAADASKGWDESWAGLDNSGPKDVISDKKVPGLDGCEPSEGNGTATKGDKGKGKAHD